MTRHERFEQQLERIALAVADELNASDQVDLERFEIDDVLVAFGPLDVWTVGHALGLLGQVDPDAVLRLRSELEAELFIARRGLR